MSNPLSLHHLTIADTSHHDFIAIAAETGCQGVCLFVNSEVPKDQPPFFPVMTSAMKSQVLGWLGDYGVKVTNVDAFTISADVLLDNYRSKIELGAELGARAAVTMVIEPDPVRALDLLGQFSEITDEFGLKVSLEPMGFTPGCASLAQALALVEKVNRANVGIAVDTLHMHLTGATPEQVSALPAGTIVSGQLCDIAVAYTPDKKADPEWYVPLALERLTPGEGVIPVAKFVQALPQGAYLDLEVPGPGYRQKHKLSAAEYAKHVVLATRALLDS